ncbi:MAG: DUF411 domain-containing protein [Advenella sp.]|uniref:DUF411 domain-containing protein n=1 Tax=unclassified Advenella TaxID=2685285 RepID=UPI00186736B4|nr:DUF411 domain-containing protein [Advenella sp. FME57]
MKTFIFSVALLTAASGAYASEKSVTVYHDPNCGCCTGWAQHMRDSGYTVNAIKTADMSAIKQKLKVPAALESCHTAVIDDTGQIVEGHVPATVVDKLVANRSIPGVAAPGMPANSPGMGPMDGNLVTVDFSGQAFSRD